MKALFKVSKWIHKYIGLLLALYVIWMSISGVLLNHPTLLDKFSVPQWLTPERYSMDTNWNRRALIEALYSKRDTNKVYICGSQGVWISENGAKTFRKMKNGFPIAPYNAKTNDIFLLGNNEEKLLAATDGGLFIYNTADEDWEKITLGSDDEKIKKIFRAKDELIVFGNSFAYKSKYQIKNLSFNQYQLPAPENEVRKFRLFSLIFHMHSGEIWGLPGRLIIDAVGIVLLFATLSGIYMWYMPWVKRKFEIKPSKSNRKVFSWLYKYHLKIGIFTAVLILFIGITGIFLLRPLSLTILGKSVTSKYYPSTLPDNRFQDKINNALYDEIEDKIIVQADRAFWTSSTDFDTPLKKIKLAKSAPGHGLYVFESLGEKGYLIGSFSGLDILFRDGETFTSLLKNQKGRTRVTGYFKTPNGDEYITELYKGLTSLGDNDLQDKFIMPQEMIENFRWSLWSFLFSLHNGRFFSDWFGSWNTAIIFTLGVLFVLVSISGTYDWLHTKVIKPKLVERKKRKKQTIKTLDDQIPVLNFEREKL